MLMLVVAAVAALQADGPGPVTPQQIESAKRALDDRLLDYPSARFNEVTGNGYVICGKVNAKNRLGAYTGWAQFATVWRDGQTNLYIEEAGEDVPLVLKTFCFEGRAPESSDLSERLADG